MGPSSFGPPSCDGRKVGLLTEEYLSKNNKNPSTRD